MLNEASDGWRIPRIFMSRMSVSLSVDVFYIIDKGRVFNVFAFWANKRILTRDSLLDVSHSKRSTSWDQHHPIKGILRILDIVVGSEDLRKFIVIKHDVEKVQHVRPVMSLFSFLFYPQRNFSQTFDYILSFRPPTKFIRRISSFTSRES